MPALLWGVPPQVLYQVILPLWCRRKRQGEASRDMSLANVSIRFRILFRETFEAVMETTMIW